MRADGTGDPGHDSPDGRDLLGRLLAALVSRMRPGRREWGQAMLAELDHVRSPSERAWFAIGVARVVAFPPRATQPWWTVPLGLTVRAVAAWAAIDVLVPAAGPGLAVLAAVPVAGAWAMLTMPTLTERPGGAMPAAQVAVVAGVIGCLALMLTTVQRYPQVISMGGGWFAGLAFDVASAGYLAMAWLLPRRFPAMQRNSGYALAAGLVAAIAAAYYVAHPSVIGLWAGPLPGAAEYLVAGTALAVAAALASGHQGHLRDGLETAAWATLLISLIMPIMVIAATYRVAPAAAGSQQIVADARLHGAVNAAAWLASDNLGGAVVSLIWMPVIFFAAAVGGAITGCTIRVAILRDRV